LTARGFQVLRFRNEVILHERASALNTILSACQARTAASPLPRPGEGPGEGSP
jgi:very-short-patch-repair endonuclease